MQTTNFYKVHLNTISNVELSDPLFDSVNRGLTLVRLPGPVLTEIETVACGKLGV